MAKFPGLTPRATHFEAPAERIIINPMRDKKRTIINSPLSGDVTMPVGETLFEFCTLYF